MDAADLLSLAIPPCEHAYAARDCAFYALSLGLGRGWPDPWALRRVRQEGIEPLPTFATVLGRPGDWMKWPGLDLGPAPMLHAGQRLVLHRPLPSAATVRAEHAIVRVIDKGEGRGAFFVIQRRLKDHDGAPLSDLQWLIFSRSAGGIGHAGEGDGLQISPPPDRAPDCSVELEVQPDAALLYRLNGDLNPIHADPAAARAAGFERPLLHGLWTYGAATVVAMRDFDLDAPSVVEARFSAPAFPGDALVVDFWRTEEGLAFRCRAPARQTMVIDRGFIR